jgi:phosphoinositide-3-kinase regulatory subunit 4
MGYLHVEHHLPRDAREAANWKPKVDALLATSSPVAGHLAPVVRLAVSRDQRFFASASHDGTCRIWELQQIEDSTGILDSSVVYSGHATDSPFTTPRVNDVAMIEGSHSVASGASDGTVHVWRVDMVSKSKQSSMSSDTGSSTFSSSLPYERSKVSGTSVVRQLDPAEGEVLAVSHFNNPAASIVTFCSKGSIHTWDLRSAAEPFVLTHSPDIGYLTTMALGSDRNWIVSGTSRGIISLWDLRFQKAVKIWQHSRNRPIQRLATSFVLPIQAWTGRGYPNAEARPFIFAASGPNECAMFDATNGSCQACFRSIVAGVGTPPVDSQPPNSLPSLQEIPTCTKKRLLLWSRNGIHSTMGHAVPSPEPSINAMVGSIGTGDNSYLITGGDDGHIRCWDFAVPSRCYTISGRHLARPSVERLDFGSTRLLQSRHDPYSNGQADRFQRRLFHGMARPENRHFDSVQDLKIVEAPIKSLLSCSRDGTIKVWR